MAMSALAVGQFQVSVSTVYLFSAGRMNLILEVGNDHKIPFLSELIRRNRPAL
jgi:hypothetical protein